MQKIEFKNLPNTDTPLSAENLNAIQDNIENSFLNTSSSSQTDTYSCDYINDSSVVVGPTEPTENNRKKVWMQNNEVDNKIYVKNDNDVYEEFIKQENIEGIDVSSNTINHTNQYLKILSVNMQNENWKANSILFKLSCTQSGNFDVVCNLYIRREDTNKGITKVELKEINKIHDTINVSENFVAILENKNTVSLYMKVVENANSPKIKILSYQKHKTEELTIYSEQYSSDLPSRNTI